MKIDRLPMWGLKRIFAIVIVFALLFCWQAVVLMNAQAQTRPEENPKPVIIKTNDPKEGYLTIRTVAQAIITLTPIAPLGGKLRTREADQKGIGKFDKLPPGRYQLKIEHEDYKSSVTVIRIERGKVEAPPVDLISKYGTVVLGLGRQAVEGVTIKLNGNTLTPAQFKTENGVIIIPRVPVGKQTFAMNKLGYLDWSEEIDVEPGSNLRAPMMERASIRLTIKSLPDAEVHLDNDAKGRITRDGMLVIRDLDPGKRKLRVRLDGYEVVERELALSLEQRERLEEIGLTPLADETEFSAAFDPRISEWTPASQKGWELRAGGQSGVHISEQAFALASNTRRANRTFNIYGDFILIFNVRFDNNKGAAWVVRAKDPRNYYLFELNKQAKKLNIYLCQNGKCDLIRPDPVLADIDEEGAFFRIRLEARGNRLIHKISTRKGEEGLGGELVDDAFRHGGAGLCAINGLEMFVNEFRVIPLK